jgi:hypothetical protein
MTPAQLDQLERELVAESGRRFGAAVLAGKVRRIITESDEDRDRQMAELGPGVFVIDRRIVDPPVDGEGVRHESS